MLGFRGLTLISASKSGREASKPTRYGDPMSGTTAAETVVARIAAREAAEGKKRMFALQRDLWSQSSEWRDQRAQARVDARLMRSSRSGVLRSGEEIRVWRVEWDVAGSGCGDSAAATATVWVLVLVLVFMGREAAGRDG